MSSKSPTGTTSASSKPATRPDLFSASAKSANADEIKKYGIKCVSVPYYLYGEFRYTNIEDAISQAKRDITLNK